MEDYEVFDSHRHIIGRNRGLLKTHKPLYNEQNGIFGVDNVLAFSVGDDNMSRVVAV